MFARWFTHVRSDTREPQVSRRVALVLSSVGVMATGRVFLCVLVVSLGYSAADVGSRGDWSVRPVLAWNPCGIFS